MSEIVEPVKLPRPSPNFCDLCIWEPPRQSPGRDFQTGDRLYAVDSTGMVIGRIFRPKHNAIVLCPDVNGFRWGALLHVYGNDPATQAKDGPNDGEEIFLRWSGLPGFGQLQTTEKIIFRSRTSIRVYPILP